ncbi:hypothetical protein PPERSA_08154 [Pseudocohnilembus persalinus]|uniref:Transmembrane protein n=1 Tax=Pseudocohnilembus persalinus TaxID=266149 RepID=A0A0V0R386_PSEPJ|nr:hypothetical protein PPERSA_08154 [Pseudocohnilembus persalinus]|eukprot:KRX08951.1 hypothetical protein PPERSA_08154 [Pseudocohnilembus persalinus]
MTVIQPDEIQNKFNELKQNGVLNNEVVCLAIEFLQVNLVDETYFAYTNLLTAYDGAGFTKEKSINTKAIYNPSIQKYQIDIFDVPYIEIMSNKFWNGFIQSNNSDFETIIQSISFASNILSNCVQTFFSLTTIIVCIKLVYNLTYYKDFQNIFYAFQNIFIDMVYLVLLLVGFLTAFTFQIYYYLGTKDQSFAEVYRLRQQIDHPIMNSDEEINNQLVFQYIKNLEYQLQKQLKYIKEIKQYQYQQNKEQQKSDQYYQVLKLRNDQHINQVIQSPATSFGKDSYRAFTFQGNQSNDQKSMGYDIKDIQQLNKKDI